MAALLKIGIELGALYPAAARWWEPVFAGSGAAPAFDLFRLRLLGWHEANFACHGASRWPGDRATLLRQLLGARTWAALFG